jgi:hypothetical protein
MGKVKVLIVPDESRSKHKVYFGDYEYRQKSHLIIFSAHFQNRKAR